MTESKRPQPRPSDPGVVCESQEGTLTAKFALLGVRRVLRQMAEDGQILRLHCEMPTCLSPLGRECFQPCATPRPPWAPSPDHYPILKSKGGHLTPDNVRLGHVKCNAYDYTLRKMIGDQLLQRTSLTDIAKELNNKKQPAPWGAGEWTPELVRKAFAS